MKKNNLFYLFLIVIFGFLLRIWLLDKPEGLWNDEYVGWHIASQKDLWLFFKSMVRNCHTPLYYLYLKLWMFFFSDADTALRYSSVFPSVLSIIIMYFSGKELKDKKLGYLCAFITAISSFLIYFAQEVRLYSLLFLFTSVLNFYAIRLLKKISKKDMVLLFVFSMLLVLTHTLGIIYVFLLLILLSYFIISDLEENKRRKTIKNLVLYIICPIIAIIIFISPFLHNILTYKSLSQFWSNFSYAKIILAFTDYFSPIQINIINTNESFLSYIVKENSINHTFLLFAILPTSIVILTIIFALTRKNRAITCLFTSSIIFFVYLILISYTGRMILITKYTTEMYPALILTFCFGLCTIKNKKISKSLIAIYVLIHLLYMFTSGKSVQHMTRPEGHLAVVELLRNSTLKNNDYVIFTYYDKAKLDKYLTDEDKYRIFSINKFNFNYFMYKDSDYKNVIFNGKNIYRNDFKELPNKNIVEHIEHNFIKNMKKGERIGIITLDSVSFFTNKTILNIVEDDKKYKKTPYIFLVFSALKNSIYASFKDKYKIESITSIGSWTLIVYIKIRD